MAIVPGATEFPRILALITSVVGLVVGLFTFIFSCILSLPALIMLAMVIIAAMIILLLGTVRIFPLIQSNLPMTILLLIFCMISSFILFVQYCLIARTYDIINLNSYFGVSIALVIFLLALMVIYAILVLALIKHHEKMALTSGTSSTTVTSSRTVTTTNIETPPANYVIQPVS